MHHVEKKEQGEHSGRNPLLRITVGQTIVDVSNAHRFLSGTHMVSQKHAPQPKQQKLLNAKAVLLFFFLFVCCCCNVVALKQKKRKAMVRRKKKWRTENKDCGGKGKELSDRNF